ncbi:hypothetical protein [Candidatus Methylobacter oryzae]|uniref:hypothetical protein n=1 Tax=Candidatus Methylobacter oryzae TaxID=2497749 RepID=UPI0012B5E456|nr:hypothetical protein [Candidatus Methylobacter oryzae]
MMTLSMFNYRPQVLRDYSQHAKIELVFLQLYAPNLNVIGAILEFLRENRGVL